MAQKYLCVYHDMIPALENLQPAEVGRLILAALKYDANGEKPDSLSGREAILWPMLMAQIDRTHEAYESRCITNKRNASAKANRTESVRKDANGCESQQYKKNRRGIQEKDNTNTIQDEEEECEREKTPGLVRFNPPTLEEVRAYCSERCSRVDPVAFWEYYNAGEWKDAKGQPVRNWKQKLLTWEKKDKESDHRNKKRDSLQDGYDMIERWANEHAGV